uniref:Uncharacterized protein n=1 Tax=Sinocyclocheilus rhinocerous TaxID=307959 RepID=A0A673J8H7_9TELE
IFLSCSRFTCYNDCLKKTTKFPNSFMIWGCMSGKGPGEMAILISTVNAQVYIDILDTFPHSINRKEQTVRISIRLKIYGGT